ncbi:TetR/AcrR family transcriptional regulator [Sphingomonas sp.]|uniref:TetR/AcrR family transcriptional regulator n=1 Tax=Sphingomonas sp. TaxID=28214 RepID=UPI003B3BBCC2
MGKEAASRRGRPRAFDRDAALTAAMHLFWTKGYSATSIGDLTTAMGINSPSLYAAFGSKQALYAEALAQYGKLNEATGWGGFFSADTARGAVAAFLYDTAEGLSRACNGCMVTLSAVGAEGNDELGALVVSARKETLRRLEQRIAQGKAAGEIPASVDAHALARFVQAVQNGMSVLARDGVELSDLTAVAETAMLAWDARLEGDMSKAARDRTPGSI